MAVEGGSDFRQRLMRRKRGKVLLGSPNITKGSPRSGLGRSIMPSSAGSGMPEPLKPKRTVAGVAFPEGTKVTKGAPVKSKRPNPSSFGDPPFRERQARSTLDVMELEKDYGANDPRPQRRRGVNLPLPESPTPPYTGPVSEPTGSERVAETHMRLKQRQGEAASDIARGFKPEPGTEKPPLKKGAYEKRQASRARRAAVAERTRRVKATGRVRNRPAGQVEVRGVDIKDSPKGAKTFKGIVSKAGLGRPATPEASWHRTFGAVAPFSGRYPNQPKTVARMPKVRPKAKPSWGGRTGAASIFAEPLAYGIAGGIKSKSFGGVLGGLKAWKEKYMPSKSSGPLL